MDRETILETIDAIDCLKRELLEKSPYDRRGMRFPSQGEIKLLKAREKLAKEIENENVV